MVVSYSHRFAFIHVPKTGGSSVSIALARYAEPAMDYGPNRWLDRIGIHVNHFAPYRSKRFRLHTPAETLRQQLPPEVFGRLFKFAFVRNPWDLLVSSYHFVRSTPRHHRSRQTRRLESFEHYVEYELQRDKLSQARMLTDRDGRLLVDDVGHFETLPYDFARICRRLGIRARLPHVNRTAGGGRSDYRDFYTPWLRDRVAEHFAAEIGLFGYTFEGAVAPERARAA
jgi:hypothetical protein